MATNRVEIWLLGRFVVRCGAAEVPAREFGGRRVRTLIRVLASRRGELVPKDALADALYAQTVRHLPTWWEERKARGQPDEDEV